MLKNILPTPQIDNNPDIESQFDDNEQIRNRLFQQIEKPRILFMGMPDRAKHCYEMNTAQAPQGPKLKQIPFVPQIVIDFFNKKLELIFNPKKEQPYGGLHLMKQNLERDLPNVPVTLVDHPKRDEILRQIESEYYPIIGLSIGAENQIPDAEALVEEIQKRFMNWAGMIKLLLKGKEICPDWVGKIPGVDFIDSALRNWAVQELIKKFGKKLTEEIIQNPDLLDYLTPFVVSGNYGASAAKKLFGENTRLNQKGKTKILWDDTIERQEKKKKGEKAFEGEGVRDFRLLLSTMGFQVLAKPEDPIISRIVYEPSLGPKNPVMKYISEKIGFTVVPSPTTVLNTAVGCGNNCDFCNTAEHFKRNKLVLFKNVDEMFGAIKAQVDENKQRQDRFNEISIWVLDENLGQNSGAFERMCSLVENSGENIHWGTSTDIGSLFEYKKKHGDFRGLSRGGLNLLWLGIESKEDVYKKRGNADQKALEEIVKELRSLGIMIVGSFIVGLPIHTEGATVQNADGTYKKINIWEDLVWDRSLNTSSNQVMMYTISNLIKGKKATEDDKQPGHKSALDLLGVSDSEMGHVCVNNQTDISDSRLEEIDKIARRMFFQENGPVVLRSLMTCWDGYKTLKDSDNDSEQRSATYFYWMAKRYLHMVSFTTVLFSESLFEKCSDKFLQRFAEFLSEAENSVPPDGELSAHYQMIFDQHDGKISPFSKMVADSLRQRFIKKYQKQEGQENLSLSMQPAL